MESFLPISNLNDFVFCPASIYYHNIVYDSDKLMSNSIWQYEGSKVHSRIDNGIYSTRKDVISGIEVCSTEFRLAGRIDIFYERSGKLVERKKHVSKMFDGFIFQLYAQCFCLREMGYCVNELAIHSLDDNKNYPVKLPEDDPYMYSKFIDLIEEISTFNIFNFKQQNVEKCVKCVYSAICGVSDTDDITY